MRICRRKFLWWLSFQCDLSYRLDRVLARFKCLIGSLSYDKDCTPLRDCLLYFLLQESLTLNPSFRIVGSQRSSNLCSDLRNLDLIELENTHVCTLLLFVFCFDLSFVFFSSLLRSFHFSFTSFFSTQTLLFFIVNNTQNDFCGIRRIYQARIMILWVFVSQPDYHPGRGPSTFIWCVVLEPGYSSWESRWVSETRSLQSSSKSHNHHIAVLRRIYSHILVHRSSGHPDLRDQLQSYASTCQLGMDRCGSSKGALVLIQSSVVASAAPSFIPPPPTSQVATALSLISSWSTTSEIAAAASSSLPETVSAVESQPESINLFMQEDQFVELKNTCQELNLLTWPAWTSTSIIIHDIRRPSSNLSSAERNV